MARALIVGCGCRGRAPWRAAARRGLGGPRDEPRRGGAGSDREAGIEPALADPARPGTILDLVGDVAVVLWLLGSAGATREEVEAIHGSALERLLERLVDTPVRGFVYEGAG